MKKIFHPEAERGKANHGWLTTRFSFSFAQWYEPKRMGFGALRVLNDDVIAPSSGFPMHHHSDMEIITIVTKGAVTHKDDMGNTDEVSEGEVQVMTAGLGVIHSEYNQSKSESLELFQIWIIPESGGYEPRYDKKSFENVSNDFLLLVSGNQKDGALFIHQQAKIYKGSLLKGKKKEYVISREHNGAYIFVIDGSLDIEEQKLEKRDALGISEIQSFSLQASENSSFLIIDVPIK